MKIKVVIILHFCCYCFANCKSQQNSIAPTPVTDSVYTYRKASPDGIGKFYMGREIAHMMGAQGSSWLERDNRSNEENSRLLVDKINLPTNAIVADIGAGTGYYSFKLSPKVPRGKIFAVEVQDEMIKHLHDKKLLLKDSIVEIVKGTDHSPNLTDSSVDLAIMVDVYHELEFPVEMLHAIRKSLKANGKLLLIEFRGEDPELAIKGLHKTTVAQLNRELSANGFQLNYQGEFLPIQHFLLYVKKQ